MKRKIFSVLLTLVLVLSFSLVTAVPVSAAAVVTPASGGGAISADTAANATSPAWTSLGSIVITEGAIADIAVGDIVLTIPSGFEFNTGSVPDVVVAGTTIAATSPSTIAATTITVTVTAASTVADGVLTIGGVTPIQVRPMAGTPLASGDITMTAGTIAGVTVGTTNFGTLGMVAGTATKLAFTANPVAVSGLVFSTQPTIEAQDQHGNINTSFADNITISVKTGPGTLLGTATQAMASGTLTTSGLGYTATADQEAFTLAANDAGFNLTEGVSGSVTCDVVATQLVFTTQPADSVSGIALTTQPVIEARDADNLLDIGWGTNVVAAEDDLGTLAGTLTVTPASGVAAFTNLNYTATADGEIFQIDFTSVGITGVTSANVTSDVVATKLAIVTQPTGAASGSVLLIQPVINAVDADGTLDAGWVAACAVAKETGTGTVTGGPVSPMVAGVATLTDVTVTESPVTHGSYTLRFTSTGLTDVVSNAFKVYNKVLDLNDDAWTLISTDDYVINSGDDTSVFEGAVSLQYKYTGSSYLSATVADIEPVEALYVKTTSDDGWAGLNYSTSGSPGASIKSLLAGWNLVSSANITAAGTVLSPLRYVQIGEQEGTGLATLVSQNSYNINTTDWYVDATTWGNLTGNTMNPFDGYWVYMNAAKSFGVIPQ